MRRGASLILALSFFGGTLARGANAQPRDPAAAEAFFAEGRTLLKQGRYPEACTKFESSQKLDPGNGTLMNLADCYEKSGRLASAWLSFREAAAGAATAGQAARASHARARAATIEPRLCRLRVTVDASVTLSVLRDGLPLDRSVWGEAVPVDPGRHEITVQNGDAVSFRKAVDVEPASSGVCETRTIAVPAIAAASSNAPAPVIASPPSQSPSTMPPQSTAPVSSSSLGHKPVLPLVVAGAGVLALGVGGYFGLQARSEWSDARSKCVAAGCGSEAQALASNARSDAGIATIATIGGAALAAGGLVWWLVAPQSTPSNAAATVRIAPSVSGNGGSVTWRGQF